MNPIVINLFGGPSSGKSTTSAGVFSLLKLNGINVELVTEFAKDLTWEERWKTLDNQLYIAAKQYHRLWRLDEVSVIITDSPIIQGLIYGPFEFFIEATIRGIYNSFYNHNVFLERVKPYCEKGRSQTKDEALAMDHNIINMLDNEQLTYNTVKGDSEGINIITSRIFNLLGMVDRKSEYELTKIN